jgi:hypothetical protein
VDAVDLALAIGVLGALGVSAAVIVVLVVSAIRLLASGAKRRREAAQRAARAAEEAARLDEARKAFRAWEYICKAHALTCTRCGELAYPIPMTADRYACPACRHQFVGAPHTVQLPPPNPDA